jgi:hypothetical protein
MPAFVDHSGKKVGRLLVMYRIPKKPGDKNVFWHCQCDCGSTTVAAGANLGKTTFSCGCLAKDTAANILKGNTYTRTHNMSKTTEYRIWSKMLQRCYNPRNHKYHIYGARGISICDRWKDSFESFYIDMGARPSSAHSIDRIDNNGNYEPGNCRWATNREQMRNTRANNFIEIEGISLCVLDWTKKLGVTRQKPYEMTRTDRNEPKFSTVDAAIRELYRRHMLKP